MMNGRSAAADIGYVRAVKEPLATRLLFPVTERRFTYLEYERFLNRLAERSVVPLREFARGEGDVALRHDVDARLESALELARRERFRGLRATYFVLHTAPYYARPDFIERLTELQSLGHEVGFHNDLLTLQRVRGVDVGTFLRDELARLRAAGIEITGCSAHGSPWCHRLGYHNNYLFEGWDEPQPGFPETRVAEKLRPHDFGLEYEAYHLGEDGYYSDSRFERRRRWHPSQLDLASSPGRLIVLTHPCHWDASARAKVVRLGRRLVGRGRRLAGRTNGWSRARRTQ